MPTSIIVGAPTLKPNQEMLDSIAQNLRCYDYQPSRLDLRETVIKGLSRPRKQLPPLLFYCNEYGSDLFNQICDLPEYYPTRTEIRILEENKEEIAQFLGDRILLVEYGSGSGKKVYPLLNSLSDPVAYMPIDISKEHLFSYSELTSQKYPHLETIAVVADYTRDLDLPECQNQTPSKKAIYFAGSTIGNLENHEAIDLLKKSAQRVGKGGGMLIGTDLKKEPRILHSAYNDAAGVTAKFNLNMLTIINSQLGADFNLDRFYHYAFYNPIRGRIEMHLISACPQVVTIDNYQFAFEEGESIHTENSHKYGEEEFRELAEAAGFTLEKTWTDPDRLFGVRYLSLS